MDVSKSHNRMMLLFITPTLKSHKDKFLQCSNLKGLKSLKEIILI